MSSIVIYFSRSGENYFGGELKNIEKGNTEVIAEYIQEIDNADLFKVEPAVEYPADYMKCIDVAKKELQKDARPEIKEALGDIASYDTIYIGFPNWWGTLPMPMFTQLEKLDFEGKTVKLLSDINLGYGVKDHVYSMFHPIGYYYNGDDSEAVVTIDGCTFDGNTTYDICLGIVVIYHNALVLRPAHYRNDQQDCHGDYV